MSFFIPVTELVVGVFVLFFVLKRLENLLLNTIASVSAVAMIAHAITVGFLQLPVAFVIFGTTLGCVMIYHHHNIRVALIGLATTLLYTISWSDVHLGEHFVHEAPLLLNLFGLLVGFELLADHFRESKLAERLPNILPDDWKGGFVLLFMTWGMSVFLDNIAAAMICSSIATTVYRGRVSTGYLAAVIAASNAGGSGSVIGDTTTTMMWIDGVSPFDVLHAFLPSFVALCVFGIPISKMQDRYHRIEKDALLAPDPTDPAHRLNLIPIDASRLVVVGMILFGAVTANILLDFPAAGVWIAIILGSMIRAPHWKHAPKAAQGAVFLLSLVSIASLMPVEALPPASPLTALGLGAISSIFDNIPLTKLALDQGGYDWGFLAFAVGFGGSMTWFGSSAGVAVANDHARIKNMGTYLKEGFPIHIAYVVAYSVMYVVLGWVPHIPHK